MLVGIEAAVKLILREQDGVKKEITGVKNEMDRRFNEHDQILTGLEGTMALILREQIWVKEESADHSRRFDKVEELLVQIVNNLASK